MNLVECLMKTGLTGHESELYITLSREGALTGYEAAKATGISRANAYQALAGLVAKGAAYTVEGKVLHYTAVPAEEYCANVGRFMKTVLEKITQECPTGKNSSEPYLTISGFTHILNKMKNMIEGAQARVYVSLSDKELASIHDTLESAVKRGLKVVAIVSGKARPEGVTIYPMNKEPGSVRLIADSSYVLTGTLSGSEEDTCLFSKNKSLVELIKDSLKNEIRLSQLASEVTDQD